MFAHVLIPRGRVPVLVGRDGAAKKEIEKQTDTKIFIGEEITIEGDAVNVLTAENIVRAVGRGFAPKIALSLTDEDKVLHVIQLPKGVETRVKARIIGTNGKARRNMERLTGTHISVYGKTVSVIGSYDGAEHAKQAIEKLISGSMHSSVYNFLESKRRKS